MNGDDITDSRRVEYDACREMGGPLVRGGEVSMDGGTGRGMDAVRDSTRAATGASDVDMTGSDGPMGGGDEAVRGWGLARLDSCTDTGPGAVISSPTSAFVSCVGVSA